MTLWSPGSASRLRGLEAALPRLAEALLPLTTEALLPLTHTNGHARGLNGNGNGNGNGRARVNGHSLNGNGRHAPLTPLNGRSESPGERLLLPPDWLNPLRGVAEQVRRALLDVDGLIPRQLRRGLGEPLSFPAQREPAGGHPRSLAEASLRGGGPALRPVNGHLDLRTLEWYRLLAAGQLDDPAFLRLTATHWLGHPGLSRLLKPLLPDGTRPPSAESTAALMELGRMTHVLRSTLRANGDGESLVELHSASVFGHAPGRRTVIRCAVQAVPFEDPVPLVGKSFVQPERAVLAHANLSALAYGPFRDGVMRVPEPVAVLPDLGVLFYRLADGAPLDVATAPMPTRGLRAAARWLAQLHGSDVRLHRQLDLGREAVSARQWAVLIGALEPATQRAAARLADRWGEMARGTRVRLDVPLHKDFHPGHVLVGRVVTVIDLDEARMGDPAFDVAHFCAYLDLLAGPAADAGRAVFLQEYVALTGWRPDERLPLFAAYSWLKIAKQIASGRGPNGTSRASNRTHEVAKALKRGVACLEA